MLTYLVSAICAAILIYAVGFMLLLSTEWLGNFHQEGMERVRRYNQRH